MSSVIRIMIAICWAVTFAFLLILSFFTKPEYLELPVFNELNIGAEIYNTWAALTWTKHSLDLYNTLYTSWEPWKHVFSSWSLVVDISRSGKYLSSYYDIQKEYIFTWDGYRVIQEGIGEAFIDSETVSGKVFIYSWNTSLSVILEDSLSWEEYTSVYLYPHMYIEISPKRWKFLKWADMIRVDTVFNIGYVWESILKNVLDVLPEKYLASEDRFFLETSKRIRSLQTTWRNILDIFRSWDISFLQWYEVLDRYKLIFVNDEKKKIIYKNRILSGLITMLGQKKFDDSYGRDVRRDLEELETLSESDHQEMRELIRNLIYLNNTDIFLDSAISKVLLSSLIYDDIEAESKYFLLYGFSIFSSYDISWSFNTPFFDRFVSSFLDYRPIDEPQDVLWNSKYQYFSYFLEKNLSFLIHKDTTAIDIWFINTILSRHISLWGISYDASITSRITWLYVYTQMLKDINIFMRDTYFLPERDIIGLLKIDIGSTYKVREMSNLSLQVSEIFNIFERNEKFLSETDQRDIGIKKDLNFNKKKLEEYFIALESYDLYVTKYDEVRQEIINVGTINGETEVDANLSNQEIQNYLSGFEWLNLSQSRITIINDRYYSVDNVIISWKSFSFDIYPFDDYKLTNIRIDNITQSVQYKLANIEEQLASWVSSDSSEWSQEITFARFFINTFFRDNLGVQIEDYVPDEVRQTEDKTEIVFKRDKLLGENGEYANILGVLPINYGDIRLERRSNTYDIFIEGTEVLLAWKKWGFYSQYFLNQIDHHFNDISMVFDWNLESNMEVRISWKVHIEDIEGTIWSLSSKFSNVVELQRILDITLSPQKLHIIYSPFNEKISIKFDSEWESYTITLANDQVQSFYKGFEKIISSPIDPIDLWEYLR